MFDLARMLGGLGSTDPWKAAEDIAASIASDGGSEPNVDPASRMRVEDLARVAELQVDQTMRDAAGIGVPAGTRIAPVTRTDWARRSLDTFRPFFERFGEALSDGMGTGAGMPDADELQAEGLDQLTAQMMGQLFGSLGPMLVATSSGSMLGHLGQRALGQYDLPIPRTTDDVLIVPTTVDQAAVDWDIPTDDLRLWILIHELTAHAVLSVPHVRARLEALLIDFASAFRPNHEAIAEQFGGQVGSLTDLSQLQQLSESFSDPDTILSMLRTPAHDLLVPQLDALVAVVLGFVDHITTRIGTGLVVTQDAIRSRFRERWIDVAPADRFMERLLGLEIDEQTLARGDAFIAGVVERAGDDGLARLWADELDVPTPAEVDAPRLWLARIGLDGDAGGALFDIPDDLSSLDDLDDPDPGSDPDA